MWKSLRLVQPARSLINLAVVSRVQPPQTKISLFRPFYLVRDFSTAEGVPNLNANTNSTRELTVEDYNSRITNLFSGSNYQHITERAFNISAQMKSKGVVPNINTYHHLMEACTFDNQLETALNILEDMIKMGITPTTQTMNILLKICSRVQDIFSALSVLELQEKYQIRPTQETYNLLMNAATSGTIPEIVIDIIEEMIEKGYYNNFASSIAIHVLVSSNKPLLAFELLKTLEKQNERVPHIVYSTILGGLCSTSFTEGVEYCFQALRSKRLSDPTLDEGLLVKLMNFCSRTNNLSLAHSVVFALEESRIPFQEYHIIPLLEILANEGQYYKLFDILGVMATMKVKLSFKSFSRITRKIGSNTENIDKAYFALEDLYKEKKKPVDVNSFNVVMGACRDSQDANRAFATYEEASSLGVVPNIDTMNVLLRASQSGRQIHVTEKVWKEIESLGLTPDSTSYTEMIMAYTNINDIDKAFNLYIHAKDHNIPISAYALIYLGRVLNNRGKAEQVDEIFKYLSDRKLVKDKFVLSFDRVRVKKERTLNPKEVESMSLNKKV